MSTLSSIPDRLRADISGFQSTDIIHVDSGMSVGGESSFVDFDVGRAASSYAELVQSCIDAMNMIGADMPLEDLLLSTDKRHTLIRMLNDTYAHVLIVDRSANLGLCRGLMKSVRDDLLEAVT